MDLDMKKQMSDFVNKQDGNIETPDNKKNLKKKMFPGGDKTNKKLPKKPMRNSRIRKPKK